MTTPSNPVTQSLDSQASAPAAMAHTRPLFWSVRRELWENRSIYIAPLAVAGVYLLGFLISLFWLPRSLRSIAANHSMPPLIELAMPYSHAAMLLMATGFVVGFFYSLEALYGERRERTILFWKSLPVSDLTTVLSKAIIPLVVLPLVVFAITVALQLIMRLLSLVALFVTGQDAAAAWTRLPLFQMELVLLYSSGRACALACAHLWLAAAGLRLGAARDISMGGVAAAGNCRRRDHRVPHFVCRQPAARPLDRIRRERLRPQGHRMASRSMRISSRWHNSLREDS